MLSRRFLLFILRMVGVGLIITGWLFSFSVQPAAASTTSLERYCQVSFVGVHAANLFDQSGALLAGYPQTQGMPQPGSGNGASVTEDAFTVPFGSTTNRLIIQQNAISTFSIRLIYYELTKDTAHPVARYMVVFSDIEVAASGSAMMDILCSSEMGRMVLQVDQTGDTIVDQTLTPSGVLTEKQIQDQVAPVTMIEIQSNPFGLFLTDMVEVSLVPRDTGSGILKTEYSLDSGSTWIVYTEPFRVPVGDTPFVFARSFDMVGNQEFPWAYSRISGTAEIPIMIWVLVGLDVLLIIIAVIALSSLRSVLKERKANKETAITRSA